MDLAALTAKANEVLSGGVDFNKVVKFDFMEAGQLLLNGAQGVASNEDGDADATVTVKWDDFEKLIKGQLDPTMAFMQGKLKVAGDMSVVMQLQSLFSKLT
ncbi:SCP2 sterol-binding domain-containing protein [Ponticaulis sp.]|uniref:SCP2 sterol-binding domain-containing protein n=1 Tax=Ponticaulis sp. TaxID=2020902 RepID=UPI000B6EE4E5|nr:SCP2 sterol-binding domain-containing protein [Ponticaulis sp.]MAI89318.1 sterol-binding protein [Ponticaulis sp.]OUY01298.1 MAG: sterol-binding protein [Hyphomonadaceae bacterium TMED5]|tara:strand:+ start:49835 stop:50137 length:303 start_codon:yes stop_codon:yes gene_type:complete